MALHFGNIASNAYKALTYTGRQNIRAYAPKVRLFDTDRTLQHILAYTQVEIESTEYGLFPTPARSAKLSTDAWIDRATKVDAMDEYEIGKGGLA